MRGSIAFLCLCCLTLATSKRVPCSKSAKYTVEVKCNWTATTHPTDYPTNFPHFSAMCGTVHNKSYRMWKVGGTSTEAVKDIAEFGSCTAFQQEVKTCEKSKHCNGGPFSWDCDASGAQDTVCTFSGGIAVSEKHSSVSMLSMLAPSPDWIVGLDSVNLCQKKKKTKTAFWKKKWPKKGSFSLYALDAGTDGGKSYESDNDALKNREPIAFFDAMNKTNIFYNRKEKTVLPICEVKITLDR